MSNDIKKLEELYNSIQSKLISTSISNLVAPNKRKNIKYNPRLSEKLCMDKHKSN